MASFNQADVRAQQLLIRRARAPQPTTPSPPVSGGGVSRPQSPRPARYYGNAIGTAERYARNTSEKLAYRKNLSAKQRAMLEKNVADARATASQLREEAAYFDVSYHIGKNYNAGRSRENPPPPPPPGETQLTQSQYNKQLRQAQSQRLLQSRKADVAMREEATRRPGIYRLSTGETISSSLGEGGYTNTRGEQISVRSPIAQTKTGAFIYAPKQTANMITGINLFDANTRGALRTQATSGKFANIGAIYTAAEANSLASPVSQSDYEPRKKDIQRPRMIDKLRETSRKDIQRAEYYGMRANQERINMQPGIFSTIVNTPKVGGYQFLARANALSGLSFGTSAGAAEATTNIPRNLKSAAYGALYGGLTRTVERMSIREGGTRIAGKIGVVGTRLGGAVLAGTYVWQTSKQIKNVDPTLSQEEQTLAMGNILGGGAVDAASFGMGNLAVTSGFPKTPYETTGITDAANVRIKGKNTWSTESLDLTRASSEIGGSRRFGKIRTEIGYTEQFAGIRGFRGETVRTLLKITPEGNILRTQSFKGGKIRTTQKSGTSSSTTRVTRKGKPDFSFRSGDLRGNPITITGEITGTTKSAKNIGEDVLLQQALQKTRTNFNEGGFIGEMRGESLSRTRSVAEFGSEGTFGILTGRQETFGMGISRVLSTRKKGIEPYTSRLNVGSRKEAVFANVLNTYNRGFKEIFKAEESSRRYTIKQQDVDINRKGRVFTKGTSETLQEGIIYPETRFSINLNSLQSRRGTLNYRLKSDLITTKISDISRMDKPKLTLPDLKLLGRTKTAFTPIPIFMPSSKYQAVLQNRASAVTITPVPRIIQQPTTINVNKIDLITTPEIKIDTTTRITTTRIPRIGDPGVPLIREPPPPPPPPPGIPFLLPWFGLGAGGRVGKNKGVRRSYRPSRGLYELTFGGPLGRIAKKPKGGFTGLELTRSYNPRKKRKLTRSYNPRKKRKSRSRRK